MRLDVSIDLPFPRKDIFVVYRDKLPDLVPYLPNVRGITVTSRTDEGHVSKLVNHWKGGGDIPAAVRKFLSDDLLEWDDHATWDEQKFTTHWRTIVPAFRDAVDAEGWNTYEELTPTSTRYKIAGELKVDAGKIKGVPRLLSGTVSPLVEKFLVGSIKPNLVSVAKGVEAFLRKQQGP
ncbi:MAG: hypothetical protein JNK82_09445, partial [Myxococcaceae bacterium]|nr:hypothetical protein [Myxococcaceae bacterium]